eukprot:gb/GECG01013344.1/.p1 GENE.gb/GECG01013344.1/~~gb/GECG01013344.1/.p1  ORF type:complete len:372 (+),score=29.18 gb/GECG01013344.1/:1-1116(+)
MSGPLNDESEPSSGILPDIGKKFAPINRCRKHLNVKSEHEKYNFLYYGDPYNSQDTGRPRNSRRIEFRDGPSLARSKFYEGFQRRQVPEAPQATIGSTLRFDQSSRPVHTSPGYTRDRKHREYYVNEYRNGDPILGNQRKYIEDGVRREIQDRFPRRERASIKPFSGFSHALERESNATMRNSSHRFFRAQTAGSCTRTDTLSRDGLRSEKKSSVLGMGRNDMRSYGVADNFQFASYDPSWRPLSPPEQPGGPGKSFQRRPQTTQPEQREEIQEATQENIEPKVMYTKTRRRYEPEPDNVINPQCEPGLHHAIPDREKQHNRILKEIKRSLPARPSTRPESLTRKATMLEKQKREQAKKDEISMVRNLPLP